MAGFSLAAVAAVLAFAGLTLWRTRATVDDLTRDRQQATADAIADTLALAYRTSGSWDHVDVHPAEMLAAQADADLSVTDPAGSDLDLHSSMGPMPGVRATAASGPQRSAEILVDGRHIGTVRLTFTETDVAEAETHVRDTLRSTVLIGALLAAVAAALVAMPLAARIVRPIRRITDTAARLGSGDGAARAGGHDAPGELGELASTFDDMAERLGAHDAARRNLAADVAHELRTPLTLLQGSCEEVLDGIAEPTIERFAQMHDDLLRIRRIVDDLGHLADADAALAEQRLTLLTRCDLADIAGRAAAIVAPMIDGNDQPLVRHLDSVTVHGDPHRLEQIVVNLLTNAAKYSPAGSSITIATRGHRDHATITVADHGAGIPDDELPRIFERFYRGADARTTAGSGIGLAVVDQLVRAHGGSTTVASSADGTTFTINLPLPPGPARI